jgi:hypothetical protein
MKPLEGLENRLRIFFVETDAVVRDVEAHSAFVNGARLDANLRVPILLVILNPI